MRDSGYTYAHELQAIANRYRESGETWPATAKQIAAWAIRNRLWLPQPDSMLAELAEDLARAMREEYITDEQGRSVRRKHAARTVRDGKQLVLWADIQTATREHMEIAFQQRRQQIVGDCRQLKVDADSYNDNANPGRPINLVFDFRNDLEELEAVAESRRLIAT